MQYHYADQDNQVVGPISEEMLHELFNAGTITADTNVFREGDTDWRSYRTFASVPPPPSPNHFPVAYVPPVAMVHAEAGVATEATQNCPFCAERISAQAKKCRFCGEILDVALRAAEEAKRVNTAPMVFMNAGGGAAASSAAAVSSTPQVIVVGNRKSGLIAALLNVILPGLGYMVLWPGLVGHLCLSAFGGASYRHRRLWSYCSLPNPDH
ncbi:MAG: DUF4339 domain-containing protein [Chthoniobacteraceae bacterium]